jgi:uncharacterized RDD family membrane protein YckC
MENNAAAPVGLGWVAGFWVRVFSDLVDAIVLGVFGFLLSLPLRGVFERLGERGVFIGLAISLAYSGVLQSAIGRGQTLGKRLLGLRVVKLDGSYLTLDRSLVRYVLVSFPVYQTAVAYALVTVLPFLRLQWVESLASGLGVAFFLGCFLVIPFHPLKRGLHDIVTGSVVVRNGALDPAFVAAKNDPRRDRRILIGGALVAVLAGVAGIGLSSKARFSVEAPATMRAASELGMANVGVMDATILRPDGAPHVLVVSGFLPRPSQGAAPDWNAAAKRLASALREDVPGDDVDATSVILRTGYNIGIFSSYEQVLRVVNPRTGEVTERSLPPGFTIRP